MIIKTIAENKKDFLDLLLLADEQEDMIDRYLDSGTLFALYDGDLKSVCVLTRKRETEYEIKNLATYGKYQNQGYATKLLDFIFEHYKGTANAIYVGTGNVPSALVFYQNRGFEISHYIRDFFTKNYNHPMFEDGIQLVDMVYLKKTLG